MNSRWPYYTPLIILGILAFYFAAGLGQNPAQVKSVLINKKVPEFLLPPIKGSLKGFSNSDLKNQVVLGFDKFSDNSLIGLHWTPSGRPEAACPQRGG